ncbi:unnamed protein product [Nezara viridula]|uniref:Sulfatase N-terminal domain-containing protein n=1 Tax=Nezara viridula TaxID=85310 RepID=A0A9P0E587_NEZVI|nr:unnamed protein product [Nezara viridula]
MNGKYPCFVVSNVTVILLSRVPRQDAKRCPPNIDITFIGMQGFPILAAEPNGLPLEYKILPEYLQELGYRTHAVGKWHLGFFKTNYTPLQRGFETHLGYYTGYTGYYDYMAQVRVSYFYFPLPIYKIYSYKKYASLSRKTLTESGVMCSP